MNGVVGSLLLALSSLTGPGQEDAARRGLELVGNLRSRLQAVRRLECETEFELDRQGGPALKLRARICLERSARYRCELSASDPDYREVAVQDQGYIRTSSAGKTGETKIPEGLKGVFLITSAACSPAAEVSYAFFDDGILDDVCARRAALFLHREEVEGKLCDLVMYSWVRTRNGESFVRPTLLWIAIDTGLPLAYSSMSMGRGHLDIASKRIIRRLETEPQWTLDPFRAPKAEESYGSLDRSTPASPAGQVSVGAPLARFDIEDPALHKFSSTDLIKGPTLITFWAAWCGPCDLETKALTESKAIKELGVTVFSIGTLDSKENLRKYIDEHRGAGTRFMIDPECENRSSKLVEYFGISAIPHTVAIDAAGKVCAQWIGFESADELDKRIRAAFKPS